MNRIEGYTLPEGCSLGLKVVYEDGRPGSPFAPEGFKWNLTLGGETEAPDWDPEPECGGGLHVWEWARGDTSATALLQQTQGFRRQKPVIWLAVEYDVISAVDLGGKIKVPKCKAVFVDADRFKVAEFIRMHTPKEHRGFSFFEEKKVGDNECVEVGDLSLAEAGDGGRAEAGKRSKAIAGDGGTAKAGDGSVAIAGKAGTAFVKDYGCATAGDHGRAYAGDYAPAASVGAYGRATAGYSGNAYASYRGTAMAGARGTASAGARGTAIAGEWGTAKAGEEGTATAGPYGHAITQIGGKARAGEGGRIDLRWEDATGQKHTVTLMVGVDGIAPDTFYWLDEQGNPISCSE